MVAENGLVYSVSNASGVNAGVGEVGGLPLSPASSPGSVVAAFSSRGGGLSLQSHAGFLVADGDATAIAAPVTHGGIATERHLVVGGWFCYAIDSAVGNRTNAGTTDAFVLRFERADMVWVVSGINAFGRDTGDDEPCAIISLPDGDVIECRSFTDVAHGARGRHASRHRKLWRWATTVLGQRITGISARTHAIGSVMTLPRRMKFVCLPAWACLLALSAASPAVAQQGGPPHEPGGAEDAARAQFDAGVLALDEARFGDAAAHLIASLEARESPPARFNLVLALRGAGRYLEALESARRYLATAVDSRHQDNRRTIETMLPVLEASIAHVRLVVTGGASRVEVDGQLHARADGTTLLQRDPGPLRVMVQRDGYAPVSEARTLIGGETLELTIHAAEQALPAMLELEIAPSQATVRIDGRTVDERRLELEPLRVHVIEVAAADHVTARRELRVGPGESTRFSISLDHVPDGSILETWWFWTIAAVGTGALATGVVLGVSAASEQQPIETGSLGFSQAVLLPY